jgi:hypothetical protein
MKNGTIAFAFPCEALASELQFSVKHPDGRVKTQPHITISTINLIWVNKKHHFALHI